VFFPFLQTLAEEHVSSKVENGRGGEDEGYSDSTAEAEGINGEAMAADGDDNNITAVIRKNVEYLIEVGFLPVPDTSPV
jgi:hypothetical protein